MCFYAYSHATALHDRRRTAKCAAGSAYTRVQKRLQPKHSTFNNSIAYSRLGSSRVPALNLQNMSGLWVVTLLGAVLSLLAFAYEHARVRVGWSRPVGAITTPHHYSLCTQRLSPNPQSCTPHILERTLSRNERAVNGRRTRPALPHRLTQPGKP